MKILVIPHQMCMGGSQINALELAKAVQDAGHDVTVYAPSGVLDPLVKDMGLRRVHKSTDANFSVSSVRELTRLVRQESIDMVHAYEWGPSLESTFGPHLFLRVPVLTTVLSMDVPHFLARHLPLTVGTEELMYRHRVDWSSVHLTEPPVDTTHNTPGEGMLDRVSFGFLENHIVVGIVCRLTTDLGKVHGVFDAIEVVGELAEHFPVRLLIVGDGSELAEVRARAAAVNSAHGEIVVNAVGAMLDPRAAYNCADIMLGMGSSALKSMAFAKPLIVQGELGFWKLLDESTIGEFYDNGWFGQRGRGSEDLRAALRTIVDDSVRRSTLGAYGLRVVEQRFALGIVAADLTQLYERIVADPPRRRAVGLLVSAARSMKFGLDTRRVFTRRKALRGDE
ncbi:glycosyltransferase family 4 protein [Rhodococcus sp. SORGH_AS_0303]|uniref:glycosyltransferase family 4 protein n=1 Tax=Rhodococcus sp. SORGH_AS_0303 TaxID=3041753 RepID=UPI00278B7568|nr:glycosyltransferase family 4 protein [Rhodococcus sp. SORGH_AS_0303]MDQ1199891.1 glycosyltransferase involved in cell wall biosynthesis [Rhodococcus sp. SORGH_AS_0303]